MEEALRQVEQAYAEAGKVELHAALQRFISAKPKGEDLRGIGARFGMSEGALHVAVHRLRQRLCQRERAGVQSLTPHSRHRQLRPIARGRRNR